MPGQKKLAQAGRADTKHSSTTSPAVVQLCGRGRQRGTVQQQSRHTTGCQVCGGSTPQVTPASVCRSLGQGWPPRMTPRCRGFCLLRELSEFSCPVTVKGKSILDRKMKETIIMGSYMYAHPAGLPWRRHLQCLQGWPLSSVWFPIRCSALSLWFLVWWNSSSDQNATAWEKDGWLGVWTECKMKHKLM